MNAGDTRQSFAVTYDYRCPFARNACEHVVLALQSGAPWDVSFWPFSLHQVHVHAGEEPDVWEDPEKAADLLSMQVGIAVRDRWPERAPDVHVGLFAARHDHGLDLRDKTVLGKVLEEQGLDPAEVFEEVAGGGPLKSFRSEHERAVEHHRVFGVPTFVLGHRAAFIRIMHRPNGDAEEATRTVERLLDLIVQWPALNELKHTTIPR